MEGGVWGLVTILSAFMIQVLTFGTTASIGVYNVELLSFFPGSTVGVSLIGSINLGLYMGSGPIVSFLMTKFSHRRIALCGSGLVVVGLLGMPLLPYIPTMCLSFGVLAGFGSCCTYIPSHVLSGLYYDRYMSLATGVTTSGSGLGGAVMPVLVGLLIDVYSWKGSFIVVAGLNLHLFICAALLHEPPVTPVPTHCSRHQVKELKDTSLTDSHDYSKVVIRKNRACLHEDITELAEMKAVSSRDSNYDSFGVDLSQLDYIDKLSMRTDKSSVDNFSHKMAHSGSSFSHKLRHSTSLSCQDNVRRDSHCNTRKISTDDENLHLIDEKSVNFLGILYSSLSDSSLFAVGSRGSSIIVLDNHVTSLQSSYIQDAIKSIPEAGEDTPEHTTPQPPRSSRHVYIFTNYGFNIYFLSNILWNAGYAIIQAFAPEFLREKGLTLMEAAWLSGAFGLACFIGGVLGGVFGNLKCVSRHGLYTAANIVMGVVTIAFPSIQRFAVYTSCLVLAGFAFGIVLGLLLVLLTDIIGVESLGNGLGYLMLSNGLGTFTGPPVASFLREATGDFNTSMLLAGVLCILGGAVMLLMPNKLCCRSGGRGQNFDIKAGEISDV